MLETSALTVRARVQLTAMQCPKLILQGGRRGLPRIWSDGVLTSRAEAVDKDVAVTSLAIAGAGNAYADSNADPSGWHGGRWGHPCIWSDGCLAGGEAVEKDVTDFFSDSGAGKGYADSNSVSQALGTAADGDTPASGTDGRTGWRSGSWG